MISGFFTSPRVALGAGAIEQLGGLGARRALVLSDPSPALDVARQRVREELEKGGARVDGFVRDAGPATSDAVTAGARRVREFAPDLVVALGGGTTFDLARALWVALERPDLEGAPVGPLTDLGLRRRARFVTVPTTSGSGADGGWTARVRSADGRYRELLSRELQPDWTLLDPTLPRSLPPAVSVDGAVTTLAHALESVASEWATPFSDALARQALGNVWPAFPKLPRHLDDDLREGLHYAATLAGIGVANAHSGLAVALATVIADRGGVAYARALGLVLPYVAEFNYPAARERYQGLAPAVGAASVASRGAWGERLRQLTAAAGLPSGPGALAALGAALPADRAEWVAEVVRHPSAAANPRVPSPAEVEQLFVAVERATPVTF